MRLHALTPAEIAFLAAPPGESDGLSERLTRRLAATLSARLRLRVDLALQPPDAPAAIPRTPVWQPDAALATLWLIRRLGGQRVAGAAPFVPRSLIDALDGALAEGWLDGAGQGVPSALAWRLRSDVADAVLAVQLPHDPTEMTRWARGVTRHG